MDISICFADFPTTAIGETTRDYRQLGIGYANLGALLMATGHGYDSEGGRALAAAITSLMTGTSYRRSAELAGIVGPYAGYARNADAHQRVMRKHQAANDALRTVGTLDADVQQRATKAWDGVLKIGAANGYRNAQASVLAPTGCLTADTLVTTDRGLTRLGEIGDVWGSRWQDLRPAGVDRRGARGGQPVLRQRRGADPAGHHRGRLHHPGHAGPPHQGRRRRDRRAGCWKRMADLSPDDLVPMQLGTLVGQPRPVPLPVLDQAYYTGDRGVVVPDEVTPELAELVGYFMGAGSLQAGGHAVPRSPRPTSTWWSGCRCWARTCSPSSRRSTAAEGHDEVLLTSVRVARWWQAAGFSKDRPGVDHAGQGWAPRIPSAILETNDGEVYAGFLRGLFEADGMVVEGVPVGDHRVAAVRRRAADAAAHPGRGHHHPRDGRRLRQRRCSRCGCATSTTPCASTSGSASWAGARTSWSWSWTRCTRATGTGSRCRGRCGTPSWPRRRSTGARC